MLERIYKAQTLMHSTCKQVGRAINIMQVSSGHTLAVFRNGIKYSLPDGLKLLSGPGCPVCVVDQGLIDAASQLADRSDCVVVTCSDMLKMPSQYWGTGIEAIKRQCHCCRKCGSGAAISESEQGQNDCVHGSWF